MALKDNLSPEILQKIEDIILAIGGDSGKKAFDHVAFDCVEWVVNAIYQRIRRAKDEVVEKAFDPNNNEVVVAEDDLATIEELPRVVNVKTLAPATKDAIVRKAIVKTAKEINDERELELSQEVRKV